MRIGLLVFTCCVWALVAHAKPWPPSAELLRLRAAAAAQPEIERGDADGLMKAAHLLMAQAREESERGSFRAAEDCYTRAADLYKRLLAEAPDSPLQADALFRLAESFQARWQGLDRSKALTRLVRQFPRSKHIPTALVMLGDYSFEMESFSSAKRFYQAVVRRFPNSRFVGYAHFRLGWCAYNVGDWADAMRSFVATIEWSRKNADAHLRWEGERDLVLVFAAGGQPEAARAFFQKVMPDRVEDAMQRLAKAYVAQGTPEKASQLRKR